MGSQVHAIMEQHVGSFMLARRRPLSGENNVLEPHNGKSRLHSRLVHLRILRQPLPQELETKHRLILPSGLNGLVHRAQRSRFTHRPLRPMVSRTSCSLSVCRRSSLPTSMEAQRRLLCRRHVHVRIDTVDRAGIRTQARLFRQRV